MSDIPQISGQQLVKALKNIGFEVTRQKGSHIRLMRIYHNKKQLITVPNHKIIRKGTLLQGILKPINLTVDDLRKLLK